MSTLLQRLLADTSPFVKKAQILIVALLVLITGLKAYIPADLYASILKMGITLIIGGAFTVNDATKLQTNGITMQNLFDLATTVPAQISEIKDALDGKLTLEQAKTIAGLQDVQAQIPASSTPPAATT